MEIALLLFQKILPLTLLVALGFIAGKYFPIKRETVASLLIYFITPAVIFSGVIKSSLSLQLIALPALFFIGAVSISCVFYLIGDLIFKDSRKNLLAFASGTGNTGYFGLPVILALYGEEYFSIAVLAILGFVVYENTLGYYFVARGTFSPHDALKKLVRLPAIYGFLAGLLFLVLSLPVNENFEALFVHFRGAYSILGMMMIGIGLSVAHHTAFDVRLILSTFAVKFLVWPSATVLLITLDMSYFQYFNEATYAVMLLLSIVPLASNTVAYAADLNVVPEKAALTVFLSTIFSLIYIPLFIAFLFPLIL
jgi:malate permease and related proteins